MHLNIFIVWINLRLVCLSKFKIIVAHSFINSIVYNTIVISKSSLYPKHGAFLQTFWEYNIVQINLYVVKSVFSFGFIKSELVFVLRSKVSLIKVNSIDNGHIFFFQNLLINFGLTIFVINLRLHSISVA